MRKLLLLIFALSYAITSFAQSRERGFVKGLIKTSDGKEAAYVTVALKNTPYGSSTDKTGQFKISAPAGDYTLVLSSVGLEKMEREVTIQSGKTVELTTIVLRESVQQLEDITVYGQENDYISSLLSPSLRSKTPILLLPQNIQVIPKSIIEDQQSVDMLEGVTRNVSGAQMIEHWGNFARINMRGFKLPAFRNGMNVEMPWGPLTEDMSMVERIEFVKGPAGFMLSAGEPGGFYNVVTKKPGENNRNEISVMTGSFNTIRSTLDVGGKVDSEGKLLYRLNLMGQLKGSHRNYEFNDRYTIAPSLKYNFNERTSLTTEYTYQFSQMSVVGAAYVFSPNGFGDLPRNFTTAEPNIDPTDIEEHSTFINLNHKINANWQITAQLGYLNYKQIGSSLWPEGVSADGTMLRGLGIWDALNESKLAQVYLNGKMRTGSITHQILGGVDIGQKDYFADWGQGGLLNGNAPFNIYDPVYGVPSDSIPVFDRTKSIRKRAGVNNVGQRYSALYMQDEIGFWNNNIRLTLAGRYTTLDGWSYGATTEDDAFTPRVGLNISLNENTTVYGLYDQSFTPQSGADASGKAFEPVRGNDIEGGIKRNWADGRWNSSLSIYSITKTNVLTADPENVNFSIQLGEVQSKGIEFDIHGEIVNGLSVVLNYANTNVEVTEDTDESKIGSRVAGHARHITNGWLHYSLPDRLVNGLSVSLGYQYQVDRSSWSWNADNESVLPDYFRLDGAVSWQNDDLKIGLNVNNLLNDYLYSGSAYSSFYYWQTEPGTNFRLNLQYQF